MRNARPTALFVIACQRLIKAVVSMGRRNTQLEPTLHGKQKPKPLATLDQSEPYPGKDLTEYRQTDGFFRGSTVKSTHWMVLHRPVEPAALTGEVLLKGMSTEKCSASAQCRSFFLGIQPNCLDVRSSSSPPRYSFRSRDGARRFLKQ